MNDWKQLNMKFSLSGAHLKPPFNTKFNVGRHRRRRVLDFRV